MFHNLRARACAGVLVAAGAFGFAVSAAPSASATTDPNPIATAVFTLINTERVHNGLRVYTSDPRLRAAAHAHNLAMAAADTMTHQTSKEPPFGTRIANAGYRWSYAGENVGWNSDQSQSGALALETAMYGEVPPNIGHRINILSRTFTQVGVDVYLDPVHHVLWLTEDFAKPA